jgi:hypothetical protein
VKGKEKEKAMNEDDQHQTENFPSLEQLAKVGIKPEELKGFFFSFVRICKTKVKRLGPSKGGNAKHWTGVIPRSLETGLLLSEFRVTR